jgi:hypothetical protein
MAGLSKQIDPIRDDVDRLRQRIADLEQKWGSMSLNASQIGIQQINAKHLAPGTVPGTVSPADTVVASTSFGQSAAAGNSALYSRGNHVHGTPAAPIAASIGAEPANANIRAHVTGTGSPHTAAGVGADPAGTAAGLIAAIPDLRSYIFFMGA